MSEEDRWAKLEQVVRRVIREEIASLGKKPKIDLINGRWAGITTDQMQAWGAAYGAVDLEAELKRAAAWCISNPQLAPKSQMGRFLNTWLTRQQNQNSLRSIPTAKPVAAPSVCAYCLKPSVGATNGYRWCNDHSLNAMDNERPPRMPGISAKQVAGS
jgi:hypothetical protein